MKYNVFIGSHVCGVFEMDSKPSGANAYPNTHPICRIQEAVDMLTDSLTVGLEVVSVEGISTIPTRNPRTPQPHPSSAEINRITISSESQERKRRSYSPFRDY
eukprot:Platyproteum_vivax@DN6117_c0_g1_i2.p1